MLQTKCFKYSPITFASEVDFLEHYERLVEKLDQFLTSAFKFCTQAQINRARDLWERAQEVDDYIGVPTAGFVEADSKCFELLWTRGQRSLLIDVDDKGVVTQWIYHDEQTEITHVGSESDLNLVWVLLEFFVVYKVEE